MHHLLSVTVKSDIFFYVGGENQQPWLHMGNCHENFEIRKIIDNATTIKVKVESYTSSATKDFNHTMATMLAAHYVFNFWYNVFYARVSVRDR